MNKKILVLLFSTVVLSACEIGTGLGVGVNLSVGNPTSVPTIASPSTSIEPTSPSISAEPISPSTSVEPTSPSTSAEPTSPSTSIEPISTNPSVEPEYISQAALDSLKGRIKLSGTYTVTGYSLSEYTYSGSITTIYDGNDFYRYNINDYQINEIRATNLEGQVALVELSANNVVETVLYEDDEGNPVAWEDMCANPLEDLLAADFLKQSDGSYAATNAEDRSLLAIAAYGGYYNEIESASVTVSGGVITSISFVSAAYDGELGSTMLDLGTVTVSEHGTATAPVVAAKPVVAEHANLEAAFAKLAAAESLKMTISNFYYNETGELREDPVVWDDYISSTVFCQDFGDTISGYVMSDSNGAYGFSRSESDGSIKLTSNRSNTRDLLVMKEGYFEGFSPALFESKGNGVFEAYEDTIDIVAPLLSAYMDYGIKNLAITVEDNVISNIVFEHDSGRVLIKTVLTYQTEGFTIPVDLSEVFALANTMASIDDDMRGIWTDGINELAIRNLAITFNGTVVSNISVSANAIEFEIEGDTYVDGETYCVAFTDASKESLIVTSSQGSVLTLTEGVLKQVGMPNEIKQYVYETFGGELTLPGVPDISYSYIKGVDASREIFIHISIWDVSIDYYILLLETLGWHPNYISDYGYWEITDVDQQLRFKVYGNETSHLSIDIWAL